MVTHFYAFTVKIGKILPRFAKRHKKPIRCVVYVSFGINEKKTLVASENQMYQGNLLEENNVSETFQ